MNGSTPGLDDRGAIAIGCGSWPDRMAAGSRAGLAGSATAGFGGAGGGAAITAGADARCDGLLASGPLGSQFLLRSASAATCSGMRCCTVLMNGTGAFITYNATARARLR